MWNPFKKKPEIKKTLILTVSLSRLIGIVEKLYANKDKFSPGQNILINFENDNQDIIFKIISDVPTPENSSKAIGQTTATGGSPAGKTDDNSQAS